MAKVEMSMEEFMQLQQMATAGGGGDCSSCPHINTEPLPGNKKKKNQEKERIRQQDVTCAERSNSQRETQVRRMEKRLEPISSYERSPSLEEKDVISWLNHWNVLTAVRSSRTRQSI